MTPAPLAAAWVARALLAAVDDRHSSAAAEHKALRYAEAAGDMLAVTRIHLHIACADLEEARYDEAIARLTDTITATEAHGLVSSQALTRVNLAEALIRVGRLDEAVHEAELARVQFGILDSPLVGAAWRILGSVNSIRGSLDRAAHAHAEAVRYAEEHGFSQVLLPAMVGLALVRAADDREAARALLDRARALPAVTHHLASKLAYGWFLLLESDERPEARREALAIADHEIAEASHYSENSVIAEALELAVLAGDRDPSDPRLAEAREMWATAGNRVRESMNAYVAARLTRARPSPSTWPCRSCTGSASTPTRGRCPDHSTPYAGPITAFACTAWARSPSTSRAGPCRRRPGRHARRATRSSCSRSPTRTA